MLDRIFPKQIDNNFHGRHLALWLFDFYLLVKLLQGTVSVFNTYTTATGADGIPLDSFGTAATQTVIQLFALLGLNLLVLPLLGVLALIRYRAMIPLLSLTMLIVYLGGRAIHVFYPVAGAGSGGQPVGFYVNLVLIAVLLGAFALSLSRSSSATRAAAT
jgi:hypothetical protein